SARSRTCRAATGASARRSTSARWSSSRRWCWRGSTSAPPAAPASLPPLHAPPDMHDKILILDFGSQVTQLIARRIREAHVFCEIHPNDVGDEFIRAFAPKGIILSGSHASTYEEHELRT